MLVYDAAQTADRLPYPALIDQLDQTFKTGLDIPDRHHHTMAMDGESDATLLLMPAWNRDYGCVKLVTVTPGNSQRGLPAIAGNVLVFERQTGAHVALLEGSILTARRTAAASALAARFLAPREASSLLIIGAGKVAAQLPEAFRAVRPITKIWVWDIFPAAAERLVLQLQDAGWDAAIAPDLETATGMVDIVSCATLATAPLLKGAWLKPGQHVDLIGAFTPAMREADDQVLQRAAIFIDTAFAMVESGELKTPLAQGVIRADDIRGDLHALSTGAVGRNTEDEITVFKSVGNAAMDLAAAMTAIG